MTGRRHRLVGVLAGVGIAVSAGVLLFGRWANSPVSTSGISQPTSVEESHPNDEGIKPYVNAYFLVNVPANFLLKSANEQPQGPVYSQVLFSGPSGASGMRVADQVAVTVGVLPSDGLSGVSAVMMRSRTPDVYSPQQYSWLPEGAVAFSRDGSESELGIYFSNDTRYAAVVASGSPDRRANFESYLKAMVKSWRWQ